MAFVKASEQDIQAAKKVTQLLIANWEQAKAFDRNGDEVDGLKVTLMEEATFEGSIPLPTGKLPKLSGKVIYVTGEDVAAFKADLYRDDQTGQLAYIGDLKQDITAPRVDRDGKVTKAPRMKLTAVYHADFKQSQQSNQRAIRDKAVAAVFGALAEDVNPNAGNGSVAAGGTTEQQAIPTASTANSPVTP